MINKTPTEILDKLLTSSTYVFESANGSVEIFTDKGEYFLQHITNSSRGEYKFYSLLKLWNKDEDNHGYLFVCKPIHIEFIETRIRKRIPNNNLVNELFEDNLTEDLISDTALEPYEKYSIGEEID